MSLTYEPLFARVLLHRDLAKVSKGGIIIPEDSQKRHASMNCEVIAIGSSCEAPLSVGDRVIVGRYAGTWLNEEGSPITSLEEAEMFIVSEDDILAIIREDDTDGTGTDDDPRYGPGISVIGGLVGDHKGD